jgi:hypothetical protein
LQEAVTTSFPVIHAVPPRFELAPAPRFRGPKNIGLVMFEDVSDISEAALQRASRFDALVTASGWNNKVLSAHKDRLPPLYNGTKRKR